MVGGVGFVGLACARWLSTSWLSITVRMLNVHLAKAQTQQLETFFTQVSTRNQGHENLNCVSQGRDFLYEYCISWDINHSQIGKWIVASNTR